MRPGRPQLRWPGKPSRLFYRRVLVSAAAYGQYYTDRKRSPQWRWEDRSGRLQHHGVLLDRVTMTMQKIIVAIGIALSFLPAGSLFAATMSVVPAQESVKTGTKFLVTVVLDTQGDKANAYEGMLVFPSTLALDAIRDQDSVVNLWIERPHL